MKLITLWLDPDILRKRHAFDDQDSVRYKAAATVLRWMQRGFVVRCRAWPGTW